MAAPSFANVLIDEAKSSACHYRREIPSMHDDPPIADLQRAPARSRFRSRGRRASTARSKPRAIGCSRARTQAGFWCGELEGDTTLESYIDPDRRVLRPPAGATRSLRLARTIRDEALPDGGWSQYPGGPADLSVSCLSYFALKVAGDDAARAPHMQRARERSCALGGVDAGQHVHAVPPGAVRPVPVARRCPRSRPR